jgi:hypothetical protein
MSVKFIGELDIVLESLSIYASFIDLRFISRLLDMLPYVENDNFKSQKAKMVSQNLIFDQEFRFNSY